MRKIPNFLVVLTMPLLFVLATVNCSTAQVNSVSIAETILFIQSRNPGEIDEEPGDKSLRSHLESKGYKLTVIDDNDIDTYDLNAYKMVFVSESCGSNAIGNRLSGLAVPVLFCEAFIVDDMGYGEGFKLPEQTTIVISESAQSHPLAAGLSGTVRVYDSPDTLSAYLPIDSPGTVIATGADTYANFSTIFVDTSAAKPIVFFFLFNSETNCTDKLTADGWRLLDAAVAYCIDNS